MRYLHIFFDFRFGATCGGPAIDREICQSACSIVRQARLKESPKLDQHTRVYSPAEDVFWLEFHRRIVLSDSQDGPPVDRCSLSGSNVLVFIIMIIPESRFISRAQIRRLVDADVNACKLII